MIGIGNYFGEVSENIMNKKFPLTCLNNFGVLWFVVNGFGGFFFSRLPVPLRESPSEFWLE